MTFKAAIFDMDGLLLDSERVCMDCFLEAGRLLGYPVDLNVYISCIGSNQERTKTILMEGHGKDFPYEEIRALWRKQYSEIVLEKGIPVKDGAEELLEAITASGTPVGLATSTDYELARTKLTNSGLADYFDFIIGGDQVSNGKPDPEIYLKAAVRLGVGTSDCIAFEDSENGVRAALAADIYVIQIPDLLEPSMALRALGHDILTSLREVNWEISRLTTKQQDAKGASAKGSEYFDPPPSLKVNTTY